MEVILKDRVVRRTFVPKTRAGTREFRKLHKF